MPRLPPWRPGDTISRVMPFGLVTSARLRSAIAAAMLAICALIAPISLALVDDDVCSMTCCVAVGHCCCVPAHRFVEGQKPEPSDGPVVNTSDLSVPCPNGGCLGGASTSFSLFCNEATN